MGRIGDSLRELFTGGSNRPDLTDPTTRLPEHSGYADTEQARNIIQLVDEIRSYFDSENKNSDWITGFIDEVVHNMGSQTVLQLAEISENPVEKLKEIKKQYLAKLRERSAEDYKLMTQLLTPGFERQLNERYAKRKIQLTELEQKLKEEAAKLYDYSDASIENKRTPQVLSDFLSSLQSNNPFVERAYQSLRREAHTFLQDLGENTSESDEIWSDILEIVVLTAEELQDELTKEKYTSKPNKAEDFRIKSVGKMSQKIQQILAKRK